MNILLDLHQWAGPQRWHGGEGQQPLHGGHCSGNPGCSGGGSSAGLCCHETFKEEEERWAALCHVDLGQTCLYNSYRLRFFQLEHLWCCRFPLLGLMIIKCCEMFFSIHGRDPFGP